MKGLVQHLKDVLYCLLIPNMSVMTLIVVLATLPLTLTVGKIPVLLEFPKAAKDLSENKDTPVFELIAFRKSVNVYTDKLL